MMTITLDVDESITSQLVYSPDLDAYLQITTITQRDIDNMIGDEQAKIDISTTKIAALTPIIDTRKARLGI